MSIIFELNDILGWFYLTPNEKVHSIYLQNICSKLYSNTIMYLHTIIFQTKLKFFLVSYYCFLNIPK